MDGLEAVKEVLSQKLIPCAVLLCFVARVGWLALGDIGIFGGFGHLRRQAVFLAFGEWRSRVGAFVSLPIWGAANCEPLPYRGFLKRLFDDCMIRGARKNHVVAGWM